MGQCQNVRISAQTERSVTCSDTKSPKLQLFSVEEPKNKASLFYALFSVVQRFEHCVYWLRLQCGHTYFENKLRYTLEVWCGQLQWLTTRMVSYNNHCVHTLTRLLTPEAFLWLFVALISGSWCEWAPTMVGTRDKPLENAFFCVECPT